MTVDSTDSALPPSTPPPPSELAPRIRRLSTAASVFCFLLAPLLLVATVYGSLQIPRDQIATRLGIDFAPMVTSTKAHLVTVLAWIPVTLAALGLTSLGRCFRAISIGQHFSLRIVKGLRRFAMLMAASSIAGVVVPTVCVLLLTYDQAPGRGQLGLHVNSQQLLGLLCAVGTWIGASLLIEAQSLKQENDQFV